MISYLKGTILDKTYDMITICVQGAIGYEIWMTPQEAHQLSINQETELFCYHHISDRTQELFGFLNKEERMVFKLLIDNVQGIGPKSALKILARAGSVIIKNALEKYDIASLEALGIGKKTAEKILLGLKGKLGKDSSHITIPQKSKETKDALDALINLGYTKQEGELALLKIDTQGKSTEEIIKAALKET